jgi:hypothetical protein
VGVRREVARIVSGGQTGVDRAALDFAIAQGLDYGGWCPRGGWAEDAATPPGVLAAYPRLRQTPSADPAQRTRWNVRDSDATLIVVSYEDGPPTGGTELTQRIADELARPLAILDITTVEPPAQLDELFASMPAAGGTLNVAGPRESHAPGVGRATRDMLDRLLLNRPSA